MNTNTRNAFTRAGAGAGVVALCAALTLGAVSSASATGFAPTANADSYAVDANTPLVVSTANGLLANDADPEGDAISAVNVGPSSAFAAGESLVANPDGSFTYTPPTDFVGTRIWSYRPADDTDQGPAVTITFTITGNVVVAPINLKPVANDDFYPVTQGVLLSISAPGVLANDVDFDGDTLTMNNGALQPTGGVLPGESMALWADGHFQYMPPTGYTGTRTWTYGVTDGAIDSELAEIVFTITAAAPGVNAAPVSGADAYAVTQDVAYSLGAPGILANDSDADGDPITAVGHIAPTGGLLPGESFSLALAGSFNYVPPTGYTGTRTFRYNATDGTDQGALVDLVFTISAPVAPANTAPVANPDSYAVVKDVPAVYAAPGFLANDMDADGDTIEFDSIAAPAGGMLPGEIIDTPTANGAFGYTPPTGYVGDRVFTYIASDGTDASNVGTITFHITAAAPVNAAPVATPDAYFVVENVPFTRLGAGYLENDTDADGDALEWSNLYMPAGGVLPGEDLTMLTNGGAFTYTPPTGFTGTREFMYLATDGTDTSNYATITFTIQPRGAGNPLIPTVPGDPDLPTDDSTIPTLAATGSTPSYALATLAAMVAGIGFVLVRSSRRVA